MIIPSEKLELPQGIFTDIRRDHPRLWLNRDQVEDFCHNLRRDPDYCGWKRFITTSVEPFLTLPIHKEPQPYPDDTLSHPALWRPLWRTMYLQCQELFYAVRHMSVAGVILAEEKHISRAKEWLLAAAAWDSAGPASRAYNDEAAFRVAAALAWGFDWLHDHLDDKEKECVLETLILRLEEVRAHVQDKVKLHEDPYNNHGVRAISQVFVPCAIATLGDSEGVEELLRYTIEIYAQSFPPWGGTGRWLGGRARLLEHRHAQCDRRTGTG